MRARPSQAGFTLPELVIVIVVVSAAGLLFSGMFIEAVRSYEFVASEQSMTQEARFAEERIVRELRGLRGSAFVTRATPRALAFVDRDSTAVGFSWTGVKGDPLVYTRNGSAQTLAEDVDSLAFGYWKADGGPAAPLVAPAATDIWRVSVHLRLARGSHAVSTVAGTFVRPL